MIAGLGIPETTVTQGGNYFWKDGRDVPDVMLALLDYPGFTVQLKVNFESGTPNESFGVKFIGSEGTMTTGFDESTIRDVLTDLEASSNASAMAVLDGSGKVRAVTGADGLRQVDLGSSPVIEAAQKEPASYFWTLPDRLLLIAVAPIRSGPRVTAFLLLGAALGSTELANITRSLEVSGAIFAGDRLIAAGSRDPATVELLGRANAFGDGASHIVRGPYEALSRVTRTGGTATAARVAWLVKVHRQSARARIIRTASVIPAVLTAVFLVGIALSKLRTLKGGRS